MTTNKITLQTITVLPIEVGEEGFDKINKCIEVGANTKDKEERHIYFGKIRRVEKLDQRVTPIGKLREPKIEADEKKEVCTEIYSTKVVDYDNRKGTSICLVREKKIDELEPPYSTKAFDTIRQDQKYLRAALDQFLTKWNDETKDEKNTTKRTELDEDFDSYERALFDIGFQKREEWPQFGPAFHYTFYIVNCSKEDENAAKILAYNLNFSSLELEPNELLIPDISELNEAFTEKISSPLELYLLANRSAFVILCVDVDEGNEISRVAKLAAIRAQSVKNSCYFYTEGTNEKLSYFDGQRLLSESEAVLTRPVSSTRDTLSDRILKSLIGPTGIQEQVESLEGLIASKKASEEAARERRTNIILTLIATAFALYQTDEVPNIIAFIVFLVLLLVMTPTIWKMISSVWKRRWKKKFLKAFSKFSKAPLWRTG